MIKLDKEYSDYTDETDVDAYPAGKAVDATTEESIDGTPYLQKWMNNIHGAFTALWVKAFGSVDGMSGQPDSAAHSDVLLAVEKLIERPLSAHSDTRSTNAHGATSTATPGQLVTRDALGRAKVAAPVEGDDIAQLQQVIAEKEARESADAAEENARVSADSGLQHNINLANNARAAADTTEATARLNADNTLQHNINIANNARISADSGLQNQITTEAQSRAAADTAEASDRVSADSALQHNINLANNARTSADTYLQNQLNALGIDLLKPGDIVASPFSNRAGCLPCHGGPVSRADFPKLNAAMASLDYPYGAGNGHSTFNVPPFNVHGAFLRGRGGNAAAGLERQGDAIRNITGQVLVFTSGASCTEPHAATGPFYGTGNVQYAGFDGSHGPSDYPRSIYMDTSLAVPTAAENRPINHAIYWHIKY